jgi:hypothetical protein
MNIVKRPFSLFFIATVVVFLFGILNNAKLMDVHIHDTYIVFPSFYFYSLVAVIFLLFGFFYWMTQRVLFSKALTWAHIVTTLLFTFSVLLFAYRMNAAPKEKLDFSSWTAYTNQSRVLSALMLVLILTQLLFLVNVIAGVIKWLNRKRLIE